MTKFSIRKENNSVNADINGTPKDLAELIASLMLADDTTARIILAATEIYKKTKEQ